MADLPVPAIESEHLTDLRSRAASRLKGTAATRGSTAVDALSVLHALASAPESASDALTLLHELQVHQVELDLQAQEMREARTELESALRRHIELYDYQPSGCFTVDPRLVLHELNQTGADMLGIGREDALGLPLDTFFDSEGASRLRLAVSRFDAGMGRPSLVLTLRPKDGAERSVLASIGADPAADRFIVNLTIAGGLQDTVPGRHEV